MHAFGLGEGSLRISIGLPAENHQCIKALKEIDHDRCARTRTAQSDPAAGSSATGQPNTVVAVGDVHFGGPRSFSSAGPALSRTESR